ncbi:MAG: CehA/McbA family metallohydrolase [Armatimonadetes bacterium]|nr:CehA/McbA family metallohydrolase [Armatimonadota bacterium]
MWMPSVLVLLAVMAGPAVSAERQVYWGDVHCHTDHSDGTGSLEALLTYARDVAHLDFVIVTDHDFGHGHPWWMANEEWQLIQDTIDSFTVPGRFVAIAGYEWTSQPKYWTEVGPGMASERIFPGPPRYYNHKNVYFPGRAERMFNAKDRSCFTPRSLAAAVQRAGGLIQNNHPDAGPEGRDQFDYDTGGDGVIANTEMGADTVHYGGKTYELGWERLLRGFLARGGRTGFVKGTDTHEGKPAARTAVLAGELTRAALFEALASRRTYAVSYSRIGLDLRINGHAMGEEMTINGKPRIAASVAGTALLADAAVIRDGQVLRRLKLDGSRATLAFTDESFDGAAYYYLRVVQADQDDNLDPSYAWSSPIWVKERRHQARLGTLQ